MTEQKQPTILLVEDEPALASVVGDYLTQAGFEHHWLENGLEVAPWLRQQGADLIVLDLMLPGCDGIEVYRQVREFSQVPVIMATARVDEIDRLLGLELGADDYLCKPYSPRELIARIRNILRRSKSAEGAAGPAQQEVQPVLNLDEPAMQATAGQQVLDLTPVEFRLLLRLFRHQGQVFSRQQLLDQLYDDHRVVTERAVDSHIKNLRKKLHAALPERELIRSIYGVGYKLVL